jgi:hypothetical protein
MQRELKVAAVEFGDRARDQKQPRSLFVRLAVRL